MKSTLVIVSGFSCTGKTALAKKIGEYFSLPAIGRDDLKESLYDSLGYWDREWSKKLGVASYKLLYLVTEKILCSGSSIIVESNFKVKSDTEKLKKLKDKYQCYLLQIHCHVAIPLALSRFKNRATSGERHSGHVDHLNYDEMEFNFKQGGYKILDICDYAPRSLRIALCKLILLILNTLIMKQFLRWFETVCRRNIIVSIVAAYLISRTRQ